MRAPLVFIAGVTDSENPSNPSNPLDRAASVVSAVVNLLHDVLRWRDAAAMRGDMFREQRSMHETMATRLLFALGFSEEKSRSLAVAPIGEVMQALMSMGTGS